MTNDIKKTFFRYVSQNILAMIGISCYVLADTYFIALSVGANGVTALNLVLPVYSLIFGIGQMIAMGSAIRFSVEKQTDSQAGIFYFTNAIFWAVIIGGLFVIGGYFGAERLLMLLGGDEVIVAIGSRYTRTFMMCAPFFMCNYICNAFVRNDHAPEIAMGATLTSCIFNIIFDYIFMFPMGMGMTGAALATGLAPVVGILCCLIHLLSAKSSVRLKLCRPSFKQLVQICPLGVSSLIGELSQGIVTLLFNFVILSLTGNIGVAAYGIVANCAIVAVALFGGVCSGVQPMVSEYYGQGNKHHIRYIVKLGVVTDLALSVIIYVAVFFNREVIIAIFNNEHIKQLAVYAGEGLAVYFAGFFFVGLNMLGASVFSALERSKEAFLISIQRGLVMIVICTLILSKLFGMTGVWLAFPTAEGLTLLVTGWIVLRMRERR